MNEGMGALVSIRNLIYSCTFTNTFIKIRIQIYPLPKNKFKNKLVIRNET